MNKEHRPVLKEEVLSALSLQPEQVYVDATFGRGGHALGILERLGAKGRLLCFDQDPDAILQAYSIMGQDPRVQIFRQNFSNLKHTLETLDLLGKVSGILLDLGVSSPQLDEANRGFSFMRAGPLDMRMDKERTPDAK
ncbi:MAG TPA: 16S rRNA (cytosine(1402)-N(4))-methyltransferase, partial [Gammaproteobacteria bacterium]|nr:16S rRNA (cytosine(1402)-N(4))-methyltransferase [Gammaproteobacteria bacterium]